MHSKHLDCGIQNVSTKSVLPRSASTSEISAVIVQSDYTIEEMKISTDKVGYTSTFEGITLVVGNLEKDITSESLKEHFSPFGKVINSRLKTDPNAPVNTGYVSYYSPAEAHRAVEAMNGNAILQNTIFVCVQKPRQRKRSKTLYQGIPQIIPRSQFFKTRSEIITNHRSMMLGASWENHAVLSGRKTSGENLIAFKRSVLSRSSSLNI